MNNLLQFYYNLYPENIKKVNNKYFFTVHSKSYCFVPYLRSEDELKEIYELNQEMILETKLIHQIIKTIANDIYTIHDNKLYVLLEIMFNMDIPYTLKDILYINNFVPKRKYRYIHRSNWNSLWSAKIDYLEELYNEKKECFKLFSCSKAYYIGLAENACSYSNVQIKKEYLTVNHRYIDENTTLFDIYNPLNFVIDFKVRSICEYLKISFFNNRDVIGELKEYLNIIKIDNSLARLLYARLLFQTYYFTLIELSINNNFCENKLLNYISKHKKYEQVLAHINSIFSRYYIIPKIEWLPRLDANNVNNSFDFINKQFFNSGI
ncbi:MAG: hypothetical protein ACK5HL_03835 [Bacilli bacterium]